MKKYKEYFIKYGILIILTFIVGFTLGKCQKNDIIIEEETIEVEPSLNREEIVQIEVSTSLDELRRMRWEDALISGLVNNVDISDINLELEDKIMKDRDWRIKLLDITERYPGIQERNENLINSIILKRNRYEKYEPELLLELYINTLANTKSGLAKMLVYFDEAKLNSDFLAALYYKNLYDKNSIYRLGLWKVETEIDDWFNELGLKYNKENLNLTFEESVQLDESINKIKRNLKQVKSLKANSWREQYILLKVLMGIDKDEVKKLTSIGLVLPTPNIEIYDLDNNKRILESYIRGE